MSRRYALTLGAAGLLALIAVVAVVVTRGGDSGAADGGGTDLGTTAGACREQQHPPLGRLPLGLRYAPLPSAQRARFEGLLKVIGGVPAESVVGRRIVRDGDDVATVLVIPGPGDDEQLGAAYENGFREAAGQQGFQLQESAYKGERVLATTGGGGTQLLGSSGCYGFIVFTGAPINAEVVGQALIDAGRPDAASA